ncbi:unnamed protein product [Spirodela intermedia]|uniref:SCP domain-containing protein n=1 Tax=Spirodela intermedia TaxID=51605 RepID=A0A7I8J6Q8_SPIIN|nr:unnamed protein product [Spirodela intermedia]CAA6665724.1 unnamed protein product [Spirodela intermedia]
MATPPPAPSNPVIRRRRVIPIAGSRRRELRGPPMGSVGFLFPGDGGGAAGGKHLVAGVPRRPQQGPAIRRRGPRRLGPLAGHVRPPVAKRRRDCRCIHSGGPFGENMFWGTGKGWRAADAVRSWALEHYDYDRSSNSCRPGRMCGHYTQIVWNATAMVGCARTVCFDGGVIMVCNYHPPGNFIGENPFDSAA